MKKEKIIELLKEMTLEEKIGQMVQIAGDVFLEEDKETETGPLNHLNLKQETLYQVGSILNIVGAEKTKKIQDEYMEKSRLKIPLLFMADIINGYKTIMPIPLAQGCSWNPEVIRKSTQIANKESSVAGTNVNYSPMVDLTRDSRWGRVMESVGGEDPFLGSEYAKIVVGESQGKGLLEEGRVAACVKHFAAYGAVEAGREYNTVDMSEREFRQYYLPAYKAAIEKGAEMIMTSFNIINGIPATINRWLLEELLRKELGFKGIIISDYSAIEETIEHGVSKNRKEAAYNAIMAGVDIDMMSSVYANNLEELVKEKRITEDQIDKSVLRILTLKNKLGLFENPYGNADSKKEKKILMNKEHLEQSKQIATESFVLLKNENNILPLNNNQKIALIGPYGDNIAISGSWSMFEDKTRIKTIKESFQERTNDLHYAKGTEILRQEEFNRILSADGNNLIKIEDEKEKEKTERKEAIEVAKKADVIVLTMGEHYKQTGEACSRSNLEIPENQKILLEELVKLEKPIIVILFNGRPIVLKGIAEKVDAILEVWFPGTQGAEAIAEVIFGEVNPSGKLTMIFPQSAGQNPIYYNHYRTGRPHRQNTRYVSRYQDIPTESYYPFGYGISYSNFKYKELKLSHTEIEEDKPIQARIKVKNESQIPGFEIIQLYIQDIIGSVVRPVKELKSYQKIWLEAGEEKEIKFEITMEMLKFWTYDLNYKVEEGDFKVMIGKNSEDYLEQSFCYKNKESI